MYFPHLVDEALMIEPTESERKSTLDKFADALGKIINENPDILRKAPHNTSVRRVDEVKAMKELILTYKIWRKKNEQGRIDKGFG